jgi:hypothetical protein
MRSATISNSAVDSARQALCREFARMLQKGALTVRARVLTTGGKPVGARFYAHRNRRWEMQPEKISDPELAAAIQETLEMLASQGHHDAWSAKQLATADHHDTDIRFHGDDLHHLGDRLESELSGILFRDRHDSKKDVRRSIHRRRHR